MTRVGPNRLAIDETQRWAEPLEENFARALGENLGASLGTERIFLHPWHAGHTLDYQVEMEIERFEKRLGGQVELAARWQISDAKTRTSLAIHRSSLTAAAEDGDYDAIVAALSRTVAALGEEIATTLRRLIEERSH